MDHLLIPPPFRERVLSIPRVQFVAIYDRNGLERLPERIKLTTEKLLANWREGPKSHGSLIASMQQRLLIESALQEWLWFGLLHKFELACGLESKQESYIIVRDGEMLLDSNPLIA
jgi:hypothetical protein